MTQLKLKLGVHSNKNSYNLNFNKQLFYTMDILKFIIADFLFLTVIFIFIFGQFDRLTE